LSSGVNLSSGSKFFKFGLRTRKLMRVMISWGGRMCNKSGVYRKTEIRDRKGRGTLAMLRGGGGGVKKMLPLDFWFLIFFVVFVDCYKTCFRWYWYLIHRQSIF